MATVPTSGAWQVDPDMRRVLETYASAPTHTPQGRGDVAKPEAIEFNRYVSQNRQRLGIPDGYEPDPSTGGQTLRKSDTFGWDDVLKQGAIAGGLLAGGLGVPALLGGGAAPVVSSVPAGTAAGGLIPTAAVPTSAFALAPPTVSAASGGNMGLGSILSWLGKGSDALDAVGRVGDRLSGAGQGSANQRMSENDQLLRQGLLRQQQANDQFSNQLRGAEFDRGEQDRKRKAAILSSLLSGTQDQNITPGNPLIAARMPQVTGGARPSSLTGNKDALLQLLSQSGPSAPTYQAPGMPTLDEGGGLEDWLSGAGLTTSILGALGRPQTQATPQRAR